MMPRAALCVGVATTLIACASEPVVQPAELGEVCGASGPFRVLGLPADVPIDRFRVVGAHDRVLYHVAGSQPDKSDDSSTVWATGTCGEAPVRVADGLRSIFARDVWPDVVLGCESETGDVVVLDPEGKAPRWAVMQATASDGTGCRFVWTDVGAVSVEPYADEFGALVLRRYPVDPRAEVASPELLFDGMRVTMPQPCSAGLCPSSLGMYAILPDRALVLTADQSLVRIDLADGTASTVQTGVRSFQAAKDGETLIWQDSVITSDDPQFVAGKIYLRLPGAGEDALLGEAALEFSADALMWAEHGLVQLMLGKIGSGSVWRKFILPGLEYADLAWGSALDGPLPDGRWLGKTGFDEYIEAISLPENTATRIFPREVQLLQVRDDAIDVLEVPSCCGLEYDDRNEGPLWRVAFDGSQATRLGERLTQYTYALDDGRLVGVIDLDATLRGSLVIVEAGETRQIDDHVPARMVDVSRVAEEGILRYAVLDGARSGVYLAKLPEASAGGG